MEDKTDSMEGVKNIIDKIQRVMDAERDQREKAIKDMLFVDSEDGQWEEDAKNKRADRPRYTIDRVSGPIDQIIGNQRQTKLSIKVFPQKDGTKEVAETLNGVIRAIENQSNSENIYDSSFTETAKGGYGGWRIITDYESDDSFDQTIYIKPINSAASSLYFGFSEEYSCKDAPWGALIYDMDIDEFRDAYPNASEQGFDSERYSWAYNCGWISKHTIRLCEFWEKVPVKRRIGQLTDGRVIDLDEEKAVLDELAVRGITVEKEREIDSHKIQMRVINAVEELEKPEEWAGKYIPLVPQFGKVSVIEGKKYIRGIVRKAIDAQRIYNYATSAAIEATALTPKDPFLATPTMVGKYQHQWNTFNTKSVPVLLYDPDPQVPGAMPTRAGAPQLQQSLMSQISQAGQDIYATTGMEPSSLGSVPVLKSGKAIQSEQEMGDRGSYVFQNNLEKSLQYTGEILVDLIPRIYDSERIIKIIGEDGSEDDAVINQTIIDRDTLEPVIVNDLSLGTYGVIVRTGPTTPTKRRETVDQLTELSAANPMVAELALDVVIGNMDINEGEELKKRVRKQMIDKGIVQPSDEEKKEYGLDQPAPPDPMNEALVENVRMQTEKLISDIRNKDADTQKKLYEAQNESVDSLKKFVEAMAKKLEASFDVTPQDENAYDGQIAIVADSQIDTLETNELGGSESIKMKEEKQKQLQMAQQEQLQQAPQEPMPGTPTGPEGPRPGPQMPDIQGMIE